MCWRFYEPGTWKSQSSTECFHEILLRYATDSLKQDPVEFQRKYAILLEMWRDQ